MCSLRENEETLIFDFDAETGVISNINNIPGTPMGTNSGWYGIFDAEWSANSSKLYLSKYRTQNPESGGMLFQYDFNFPLNAPILIHQVSDSDSNLGRGLRRGPDGKIYWIYHNPITSSTQYLGTVNSPNLVGALSDFQSVGIDMGATLGLTHLFPTFLSFKNTIPTSPQITTDYIVLCSDLNPSLILDLSNYLTDAEGDELIINSVEVTQGQATINGDAITYIPPDQYVGTITMQINYCDDYCFPLCDSLVLVLNVENTGIAASNLFPEDSITCNNSVVLSLDLEGYEILWNTGETSSQISVNTTGDYGFIATSSTGCEISDSISVLINAIPYQPITPENILECDSPTATIEINPTTQSILWSTGQTSVSIVVDESGTYSVTIGNPNFCPITDFVDIDILQIPDIEIAFDDEEIICDETPISILVSGDSNGIITWNTGQNTDLISVSNAGIYSVIVSNDCGVDEASVSIESDYSPFFDLPQNIYQCFALDTILEVPGFESYLWSDGTTEEQIYITEEGVYSLTVENLCGVYTDEVSAFVDLGPSVDFDGN